MTLGYLEATAIEPVMVKPTYVDRLQPRYPIFMRMGCRSRTDESRRPGAAA
jgi:hypothetical protein